MDNKRGIRLFNQRGITIVELIVASTVGIIVAGAVFYFISFAGDGARMIRMQQQLEQEASLISELFTRNVRNGYFICVGDGTIAPTADQDNVSKITVRDAARNPVATFEIAGNTFKMNGSQYLTAYLCDITTPASHFKVFQNGKHAEFYLSMSKTTGGETINYTQTIGDVRCRN